MSISVEDFTAACEALEARCRQAPSLGHWKSVQLRQAYGSSYLRIEKSLILDQNSSDPSPSPEDLANEVHEDDPEAIPPTIQTPTHATTALITYELHHSPTYQVPILYISSQPHSPTLPTHLTNPTYASQISSTGVMGALTLTDHPITGLPVWFVHPCRTSEALEGMVGEREVGAGEYLGLWFGVVGAAVGLGVPVEAARVRKGVEELGGSVGA